jgi:hypothetical protein
MGLCPGDGRGFCATHPQLFEVEFAHDSFSDSEDDLVAMLDKMTSNVNPFITECSRCCGDWYNCIANIKFECFKKERKR